MRSPAGVFRSRTAGLGPALTLFLVLFAAQAGAVVLTPVAPDIAADFHASVADVGRLRIASALTGGLSALALGRLTRRMPARRLLVAGLVVLAAGSAASAAAPSLALLAAAQAVVGVALAVLLAAGITAAAEWSPPSQRARTLAWALAGPPTAWIVGMPAVAVVATGTWRAAWLGLPLVASLLALAAVMLVRPRDGAEAAGDSHAPGHTRDRTIAGWAAGETLLFAAWGGSLVYAGALLRESYGATLSETGLALGVAAIAFLPGTFLARRWAERSPRGLLTLSGSSAAVLVAVFGLVRPSLAFSVTIFAALAFAAAARTFAGSVAALHARPERRAAMTSARASAMQFGYLLGAGAGALALDAGGYGALGASFGMLFASGVIVSLIPTGTRHTLPTARTPLVR